MASDHFVLFVDVLGFAAATFRFESTIDSLTPAYMSEDPKKDFVDSIHLANLDPLARYFEAFHRCVERASRSILSLNGHALVFSDSAFFEISDFDQLSALAKDLMRECIGHLVPVRMGIGFGSFRVLRFSADTSPTAAIHSLQFLGTAVVRAYQAERCAPGLRIFLHRDLGISPSSTARPFSVPFDASSESLSNCELNYLFQPGVAHDFFDKIGLTAERRDHYLYGSLNKMAEEAPKEKRHYYEQTLTSWNSMRKQLGRPPFA